MWRCHSDSNPCLVVGLQASRSRGVGPKNIFLKNASNIYGLVSFDWTTWLLCIMLYTCSYISFLMAACKMISFNEHHKKFSLQKIFYLHCVCIFSLSNLGVWGGGGGRGVIKYKSMGKMCQIFYQYSHTHYF